MIYLTRLNHGRFVLNSDLITHVEATPDTVITLTTGERLMVLESAEDVINRVVEFRRAVFVPAVECPLLGRRRGERVAEGA